MKKPFSSISSIRAALQALPLNLRAKLVLGNLAVVLLALVAMGYYVFFRAQQANAFLTGQLDESLRQKAEDELLSKAAERAAVINAVFTTARDDVITVGAMTERLLPQEAPANDLDYGGASQALVQLPGGSWDNSNGDSASIFIPATVELSTRLVSELSITRQLDAIAPAVLATNPDAIAVYFGGQLGEEIYYPNIDLAATVPPGFAVTQQPWYLNATPAENPERQVVWSEPRLESSLHGLVVTTSIPVFDSLGEFRGVAAVDIRLSRITDLVSQIHVGQTGFAFLLDSNGRLMALPEAGYESFGVTPEGVASGELLERSVLKDAPMSLFDALIKMTTGQTGLRTIQLGDTDFLVAYRPVPEVRYSLGLMVPVNEMLTTSIFARQQILQIVRSALGQSTILVSAVLIVSLLASLIIGRGLTAPLTALTKTAKLITDGNLQATADIRTRDEVGTLAGTLNSMTASLRGLIESLEARVAERTVALESARRQSEKRASELQTIGEISTVITSEKRLETLLPLITRLVSERFGFYHVGIFLVDEGGNYAVLQAANSAGGQQMLARGHRLQVGVTGIVGDVARSGRPRIALDVGADPTFFNNPDLPATRSEMALPLNARARTIGVLDVQSAEPGAFTEADTNNLRILADQIASVIENARLFGQSEEALAEASVLYRQYLQQGWREFLDEEKAVGYRQELIRGRKLESAIDSDVIREVMNRGILMTLPPENGQGQPSMLVPIRLRGQMIGVMKVQAAFRDRDWSQDEIDMAEAVSARLALALENARLIQDSQRRAAKERTIGEITAKIGASINMRNVLESAAEELGRALPGTEVVIQFQDNTAPAPEHQRPD